MLDLLAEDRGVERASLGQDTYWLTDAEAVRHLYRVASSLTPWSSRRVRSSARYARRTGRPPRNCAGQILNRLFSLGSARRSADTGIGDSSLSVPRVAVNSRGLPGISQEGGLWSSARERYTRLVVKHLKDKGVADLLIATVPQRASLLAERVGGRAVAFDALAAELKVDVVVSSTGSGEWVVRSETVGRRLRRRAVVLYRHRGARDTRPVVQTLERIYLYDIDDLQAVVGAMRRAARTRLRRGGHDLPAVLEFTGWLSTLHVVPLIQELRDGAEQIRRHELARASQDGALARRGRFRRAYEPRPGQQAAPRADPGDKARAEAGSPLESSEVRRRLMALDGLDVELRRESP